MRRSTKLCLIAAIMLYPFFSDSSEAEGTLVTFDMALDEAYAHNPSLNRQGELLKSFQARKWSDILPNNPEFFIEEEGIPDNKPLSRYEERKTGISQELDFPMAYVYRAKHAALEEDALRFNYIMTQNEIKHEVRKAYYRVLMLKAQHKIYYEAAEFARRILKLAEAKVKAGESTSYETLRARVDLAEAERNLTSTSKEITISLYTLKQIMGRDKDDPVDIAGDLTYNPVQIDVDTLKETAMNQHPALRHAMLLLDQQRIGKKSSLVALFPSISLGYFRQRIHGDENRDAWGGELSLSIPIWGLWKERGEIISSDHEIEAAGWHIEEEKRHILLGVEEAASNVSIAQDEIANYQANMLNETEELVRIVTRRYEEGETSYLEVIETTRTMQRVQAGYYTALYDCLVALADLELAVGTHIIPE